MISSVNMLPWWVGVDVVIYPPSLITTRGRGIGTIQIYRDPMATTSWVTPWFAVQYMRSIKGLGASMVSTSPRKYQNNSLAHTPHAVRHPSISLPASASHPGRHRCRTRRGRAKVALHEAQLPSLHLARAALSRILARITRPCRPRKLHGSQQGLKEHAHVAAWLHTGSTLA